MESNDLLDFKPQNQIERSLFRARNDEIDIDDFLAELVDSRIHLIYKSTPDKKDNFYYLEHVRHGLVLAAFTSSERIKIDSADFKIFTGNVEVDFRAVFDIGEGFAGLVLNPGWTSNMERCP